MKKVILLLLFVTPFLTQSQNLSEDAKRLKRVDIEIYNAIQKRAIKTMGSNFESTVIEINRQTENFIEVMAFMDNKKTTKVALNAIIKWSDYFNENDRIFTNPTTDWVMVMFDLNEYLDDEDTFDDEEF